MPALYILAGPNGTGKTSYYEVAITEGFIDATLPFVNVDLITRELRGGYTTENFTKADEIARQRISNHLNAKSDFMIESNLSTQKDYDWVHAMQKAGYEVILFFLCTSHVEINIGRVQKRVAEGGHDIAVSIIEHRYKMGLTYLKGNLHLFNKAYLIDNSSETALVMAEISEGIIVSKEHQAPQWVNDALYIIERIKKK
jgi:predicted ABC-type ATPase